MPYNTYSFDGLDGKHIAGTGEIGEIVINGFLLEGTAIPTKRAGAIVPNRWSLNQYDLARVDDNLVIVEAGSDPLAPGTPKITIDDFPFDSGIANFRLLLGKTPIIPLVYGESRVNDPTPILGGPIFPSANPNGRFYAASQIDGATALGRYDNYGNLIGPVDLSVDNLNINVPSIQQAYPIATDDNGRTTQVLLPYRTADNEIGVAKFDVDSGRVTASTIFAEVGEEFDIVNLFAEGAIGVDAAGQFFFRYQRHEVDATGSVYAAQPFNPNTLNVVADEKVEPNVVVFRREYGGSSDVGFRPALVGYVELPSGVKISMAAGNGAKYLQVSPPSLEPIPIANIPDNTLLPPGSDLETDENDLKVVIDFEEEADGEPAQESTLIVTPVVGTHIVVRNLGDGNQLNLGQFNLTEDDLREAITQVGSSQYSMEELLDGEYDPINESNTDDNLEPGEEVTTVLTLPIRNDDGTLIGHQQIFIPGIDQQEFLEGVEAGNFLIGYGPTTTRFPTQDPTQDPSTTFATNSTPWLPETTTRGIATTTRPGIGGGEANAIGAGFSALIALAGAAIIGGIVLLVSEDARTATANGLRRAGRALNPRNWFGRRGTEVAPTDLEMVTARDEEEGVRDAASAEDDVSQQTGHLTTGETDADRPAPRNNINRKPRRVHFEESGADAHSQRVHTTLRESPSVDDLQVELELFEPLDRAGEGYEMADPNSPDANSDGRGSPNSETRSRSNSVDAAQLQDPKDKSQAK
jgi:hypothetical protein